jgi:hypothetical protein
LKSLREIWGFFYSIKVSTTEIYPPHNQR